MGPYWNSNIWHSRNIIKHAMDNIHLLTVANPIQIIVDVVINRYLENCKVIPHKMNFNWFPVVDCLLINIFNQFAA